MLRLLDDPDYARDAGARRLRDLRRLHLAAVRDQWLAPIAACSAGRHSDRTKSRRHPTDARGVGSAHRDSRARSRRLARMDAGRDRLARRDSRADAASIARVTRIDRPALGRERSARERSRRLPELSHGARDALSAQRLGRRASRACRATSRDAPQRFVIGPRSKHALTARIRREFPGRGSPRGAARRPHPRRRVRPARLSRASVRPVRSRPYRRCRTGSSIRCTSAARRTRSGRRVPYLDPACGDHKIIWELNRHQHWLALGRAFWLTGDRRYRDRFVARARELARREPAAHRHQLGEHAGARVPVAVVDLGDAASSPDDAGRRPPRADAPWLVDLLLALDRQLDARRAQPVVLLQPQHAPARRGAGALRVRAARCPSWRQAPGARRSAGASSSPKIDRQIGADGGHCERSTHYHRYTLDFYPLALIVARSHGDPGGRRSSNDAVARLAVAARLLADDHGRLPHIGDDDGGALLPITGRAPDDLRDSLAIAAALVDRPELRIGAAPEEALLAARARALAQSTRRRRPQRAHVASGGAARHRLLRLALARRGDHLVIDGGPHGYQNGGHAHADALSLTLRGRAACRCSSIRAPAATRPTPALRDRLRSTALHNTLDARRPVAVGAERPIPLVARREQPRPSLADARGASTTSTASHDGYRPLEHRRRVLTLHGDLRGRRRPRRRIRRARRRRALAHRSALVGRRRGHEARSSRVPRPDRSRRPRRCPQAIVERFSGDARHGPRLALAGLRPRRADDDASRQLTTARAPFWMVSVFDLDPRQSRSSTSTGCRSAAEAGALGHGVAHPHHARGIGRPRAVRRRPAGRAPARGRR